MPAPIRPPSAACFPKDGLGPGPAGAVVLTRREAQAFDRHLQEECGIPASLLMENAGASLASHAAAAARATGGQRVLFLVGPGNNGGDALVAARHLHGGAGIFVAAVAPLGLPEGRDSPASAALRAARAIGVQLLPGPLESVLANPWDLVVDGLFGVGLSRPLEGAALDAVDALARSPLPVLAVDVPSGLDCDTGLVLGAAPAARWTLTFVAPKAGFFRNQGPSCCGTVSVAGIGVSSGHLQSWLEKHRSSAEPPRTPS